MWVLVAVLACGDKDSGDTGTPATSTTTLAEALSGAVPAGWSTACLFELWEWDDTAYLTAVDPDSGEQVSVLSRPMGDEDWDVHGLTWDGVGLITSGEGSVARLDLATASLDWPSTSLKNVAAYGDQLLVERDEVWSLHASWDDAVAGTGGEEVPELFEERVAMQPGTDYALTTVANADEAKIWHVPSGGFGDLPLDDFEGYVWGLSVIDATLYLLNDGRTEDEEVYDGHLYAFDITTGARLLELDLGVPGFATRGLVCTAL